MCWYLLGCFLPWDFVKKTFLFCLGIQLHNLVQSSIFLAFSPQV